MSSFARKSASPSVWTSMVGLTFAAAGIAKLAAVEPEAALFKSWGWSTRDMQTIGAAELLGALLLVTRPTQLLGASLLSSSSVCVLLEEIRHGNDRLVTPRAALLLASLTGFMRRA